MSWIRLSFLEKHRDWGLLVIRLGVGLAYMAHGWPIISGGVGFWTKLGGAMAVIGITFAPVFWGFMAAVSEFFGGLLVALGLFTRPAAGFMGFTMLIALSTHLSRGDAYAIYSHPLKMVFVFIGLVLLGAGKYSFDNWCERGKPEPPKE
ncbi:MAG: DoxX family protein [Candidatus Glassbacteria bacterium]